MVVLLASCTGDDDDDTDDGAVAWDDTIVSHLPDFALSDEWVTDHVTIEDVYAHRSGLPEHAGDLLYNYTNVGLTAGAEAVAEASDTSWAELSRSRLYDRIGMTSTSSDYADFAAEPKRAVAHQLVDGEWEFVEQRVGPDAEATSVVVEKWDEPEGVADFDRT